MYVKIPVIFTFLLVLLSPKNVFGACEYAIPEEAVQISKDSKITGGNKIYWVCTGTTFEVTGGTNYFFLEPGAHLILNGGNQEVYMRKGASLVIGKNCAIKVFTADMSGISRMAKPTSKERIVSCRAVSFSYKAHKKQPCNDRTPKANASLIPQSATLVTEFLRKQGERRVFWICGKGRLDFTGNRSIFYVEKGGVVSVRGNNQVIYLKSKATAYIDAGKGHKIYFEKGAVIRNNTDAADVQLIERNSVEFDYSVAPDNACLRSSLQPQETFTERATNSLNTSSMEEEKSSSIPNNARVISNKKNGVANEAFFLICQQGELALSGNKNVLFVEPYAKVILVRGQDNTVYLKRGASLTIHSEYKNKIYYERGSEIMRIGVGNQNQFIQSDLSFNYQNAPVNRCNN